MQDNYSILPVQDTAHDGYCLPALVNTFNELTSATALDPYDEIPYHYYAE